MKATQYQGNKSFSVIDKEIEAPAKDEVRKKWPMLAFVVQTYTSIMA